MARIPIGLQLYTVRDLLAEDVPGTIKAVARIGYEGVEVGGLYGLKAKEWKRLLADHNLKLVGGGVGLRDLQNDLARQVDTCRELGVSTLMIGAVQKELREANGDWKRIVAELAEACAKAKEAGLRILYHNHAYEFQTKVNGMYALDYVYASISAETLKGELDTYWIKTGGEDPVAYIRKYAGRVPFLHIKDRAPAPADQTCPFAEIGQGFLDWDAIFAAAQESGVEWHIVEQDRMIRPSLESARMSFDYMKAHGMV